jgi:hypothetical protein
MVMRFTATVKNHEVVIRDVQLPDGEVVEVTVEPQPDDWEPTPEEWREIELGDADVAAGRTVPIDEVLEKLRRAEELWYQTHGKSRPRNRSGNAKVAAPRTRTKPAARRARSRK